MNFTQWWKETGHALFMRESGTTRETAEAAFEAGIEIGIGTARNRNYIDMNPPMEIECDGVKVQFASIRVILNEVKPSSRKHGEARRSYRPGALEGAASDGSLYWKEGSGGQWEKISD